MRWEQGFARTVAKEAMCAKPRVQIACARDSKQASLAGAPEGGGSCELRWKGYAGAGWPSRPLWAEWESDKGLSREAT